MSATEPKRVFMVAGEASGDQAGGALLHHLSQMSPIQCMGVGSTALQKAGMQVLFESKVFNVVGLADWIDRAGAIWAGYRKLRRYVLEQPIDAAILVDLPDLNLALAQALRKRNIPTIYYISPQVWAWRRYRVHKIRRSIDKMLVLFPFEKEFYEKHGIVSEFVGHPLLERVLPRTQYRSHTLINQAPQVALLPGSRHSEIRYHLPIIREVVKRLHKRWPKSRFRLPVAETVEEHSIRSGLMDLPIEYVSGQAESVVKWADVAVVASGTATLETALCGTPLCMFYRIHATTAWLFKNFAGYQGFFSMPNILLGDEVVQEFVQHRACPDLIEQECIRMVEEAEYRSQQIQALKRCRELLFLPNPAERAARAVADLISGRK